MLHGHSKNLKGANRTMHMDALVPVDHGGMGAMVQLGVHMPFA